MRSLLKKIFTDESGQVDWNALLGQVAGGNYLGAVASGVGGLLGAVAGGGQKGVLVGGTVTQSGGGRITIKTTKGHLVTIKRAKHRRYTGRRGGGMNAMLKQAMQYKMLSQAMK